MSRKRNMPSRKKIFDFWNGKLKSVVNDNTCFKCGVTSVLSEDTVIVDRAHILAVCEGGSDELDNLHLLCRSCHRDSEVYSGEEYNLWFLSKSKEQFATSLFVLWDKGELNSNHLDDYFNKVKSDCIKNVSQEWYDFQIKYFKEKNKTLLYEYENLKNNKK